MMRNQHEYAKTQVCQDTCLETPTGNIRLSLLPQRDR